MDGPPLFVPHTPEVQSSCPSLKTQLPEMWIVFVVVGGFHSIAWSQNTADLLTVLCDSSSGGPKHVVWRCINETSNSFKPRVFKPRVFVLVFLFFMIWAPHLLFSDFYDLSPSPTFFFWFLWSETLSYCFFILMIWAPHLLFSDFYDLSPSPTFFCFLWFEPLAYCFSAF
jgi:hypothetical protein